MTGFTPFPKIPRLFKDVVITEKIDGTNGGIRIIPQSPDYEPGRGGLYVAGHWVYAQSRNKDLPMGPNGMDDTSWEKRDNFGFARWVRENAENLVTELGPGIHYGEWWGSGIQRGYGLKNGEKRFSLFNRNRWGMFEDLDEPPSVPGLGVVPTLYQGPFDTNAAEGSLELLREIGSYAAPGFMTPEGVVVYHTASRQLFKATFDAGPKGTPLVAVTSLPPRDDVVLAELVLAA